MSNNAAHYRFSFYALTVLFFMWGFITVMNDVLINTFPAVFELNAKETSIIQLAFFGSFFVISLLYFAYSMLTKKDIVNTIGYKNGMVISLLTCSMGCAGFYFAAQYESYSWFIYSLLFLGAGVTFLQICANPFVTILGDPNMASSRLNLAQGLNSLGTTIGPIVGVLLIYSVFGQETEVQGVGNTYLVYGIVFFLMAIIFKFLNIPEFKSESTFEGRFDILKNKQLMLGVLAIFCYVGAEVSVGSWIGKFAKLDEIMGANETQANSYLAFFWGGLMIGRLMASISLNKEKSSSQKLFKMIMIGFTVFFFIWLINGIQIDKDAGGTISFQIIGFDQIWVYLFFLILSIVGFIGGKGNAARLIIIFSCINLILITCAILFTGPFAFWCILGTGLFFSIGWSNIFSLSIKGLGTQTSMGSSLLVMAIVGGAIIPGIQSNIIDEHGVQLSFLIPLMAVLFLIYFGFNRYKSN